jgi:hypothetical protein
LVPTLADTGRPDPDAVLVLVVLLELLELLELLPQAAISKPVASAVRPSIMLCVRREVHLRRVMSGPFWGGEIRFSPAIGSAYADQPEKALLVLE